MCPTDLLPLNVPSISRTKKHYSYLRDVDLVIPTDDVDDVEILVGLDYYFSIVCGRTLSGPPANPVAAESILHWMICGKVHVFSATNKVFTNLIYTDVTEDVLEEKSDLKCELMKFWGVETFCDDVNDTVHENLKIVFTLMVRGT